MPTMHRPARFHFHFLEQFASHFFSSSLLFFVLIFKKKTKKRVVNTLKAYCSGSRQGSCFVSFDILFSFMSKWKLAISII